MSCLWAAPIRASFFIIIYNSLLFYSTASFYHIHSCKCKHVNTQVTFDYTAANEDELDLKVGQLLRVVTKDNGGWWQGELDGKTGWFPDNFVEPARSEECERRRIIIVIRTL